MQTILDILMKAGGWHHGLYLKIDNPPNMELVIEAMDESGRALAKRCNISTQELGGVGGTSGCRSLHSQPVSARRRRVSDRIVTLKPDDVCEQSSPSDESTTAMKLLVQSHGSTLQGVFDR